MGKYKSVFDIIGPVMVGPSSSHTAGAVRIGAFARTILGGTPRRATIELHGSFAETGPGHGTDKGLLGGLLGMSPDDPEIRHAYERAREAGMSFTMGTVDLGPKIHPCSARLTLEGESGDRLQVIGTSIGGGNVAITQVNGYQVRLTGEYPAIITVHTDTPGMIQHVTSVLAAHQVNVAFMNVARQNKGQDAFMTIESDQPIPEVAQAAIAALPGIKMFRYLPKLT